MSTTQSNNTATTAAAPDATARHATEKAGWKIPEWSGATGIGKSRVSELIAKKRIRSRKFGASRIITTPPAEFLDTLPED